MLIIHAEKILYMQIIELIKLYGGDLYIKFSKEVEAFIS